jgi:quinol monooxygenase YgiN
MHRYLQLLVMTMALAPLGSNAQTPPAIEGPVYVATYVELVPTAVNEGGALLKQYRDASRKDAGNVRTELVQEVGRPTRFAILGIWADQKAFDMHGKTAHTAQFRDKLKLLHAGPYDERVHSGMSVGARDALRPGSVVVVTHVDVPGSFKDATVPLLQQLSETSRKEAGNLRFEVQQQGNRPNHFTVVELWTDQNAYDAHVLAGHTRQFRDTLGPMAGALYDERLYKAFD